MADASSDAKILQLLVVLLKKGKLIMEYPNLILGLVLELKNAGHLTSALEQMQVLLHGIPEDNKVTVESIMSSKHTYHKAISKRIVPESRLGKSECASLQALVAMTPPPKKPRKCFYCGKQGLMARECQKKKAYKEKHERRNKMKWFMCVKVKQVEKDCSQKDDLHDSGGVQGDTGLVNIAQTAVVLTASSWKSI